MTDIITEPGIYRMRNGGRALITTISTGPETAKAKGQIERMFRGKPRFRGYQTWQTSGAFRFLGESRYDIIEKL